MYKIGDHLTNDIEVSEGTAIVIEVMAEFVDTDDGTRYYVIKCVSQESKQSWLWVGDIEFECEAHLDKYYEPVKDKV